MSELDIRDIFPKGKTLFFEIKINTDNREALGKLHKLIFQGEGLPEGITCDQFWFANQTLEDMKKAIKCKLFEEIGNMLKQMAETTDTLQQGRFE